MNRKDIVTDVLVSEVLKMIICSLSLVLL